MHFYGSVVETSAVFGAQGYEDAMAWMDTRLTGPSAMLRSLRKSWHKNALSYSWLLPDLHEVFLPVTETVYEEVDVPELKTTFNIPVEVNKPQNYGVSLVAHATHSCDGYVVHEMSRRLNYAEGTLEVLEAIEIELLSRELNPYSEEFVEDSDLDDFETIWNKTGVMSVAITAYIDPAKTSLRSLSNKYLRELSEHLNRMLDYPSFHLLTVHDEFLCHPNHCDRMVQEYQQILSEFVDSSMLAYIIDELEGDREVLSTIIPNPELREEVRTGKYGIH